MNMLWTSLVKYSFLHGYNGMMLANTNYYTIGLWWQQCWHIPWMLLFSWNIWIKYFWFFPILPRCSVIHSQLYSHSDDSVKFNSLVFAFDIHSCHRCLLNSYYVTRKKIFNSLLKFYFQPLRDCLNLILIIFLLFLLPVPKMVCGMFIF